MNHYDNERRQEAAQTILMQLGGNQFKAMVGIKQLTMQGPEKLGLSIKFTGSKVSNYMRITLNGMDTYDLEFGKIRGTDYKVVKTFTGIYADQLRQTFTEVTGLYTRL